LTSKKKIAIFGLGAIGSVIAKELVQNSENSLLYFTRSPKASVNIEFLNKNFSFPIDCNQNNRDSHKLDWLIICLKEYQYSKAKSQFAKLISNNCKVAIVRNGMRLKNPLLEFTSDVNILECMVDCPVQPIGHNMYKQFKSLKITVLDSQLAESFSSLFQQNSNIVSTVKDFKTASWKKLIESSALGAILCITGKTCRVFQNPELIDLYRKLVKEGIDVALSDGAKLSYNLEDALVKKLKTYDATKGSSMLTDRINNKPIELNAKNGVIVKIGLSNNVPTPFNKMVCALINPLN